MPFIFVCHSITGMYNKTKLLLHCFLLIFREIKVPVTVIILRLLLTTLTSSLIANIFWISKKHHRAYWRAVSMILPVCFEKISRNVFLQKVQFKKFCCPMKTSCPPAENLNEIPEWLIANHKGQRQCKEPIKTQMNTNTCNLHEVQRNVSGYTQVTLVSVPSLIFGWKTDDPNTSCDGDYNLPRSGLIWPRLTIIYVIHTCLLGWRKGALYDSFFIASVCSLCTSTPKNPEKICRRRGFRTSVNYCSITCLTDNWQKDIWNLNW